MLYLSTMGLRQKRSLVHAAAPAAVLVVLVALLTAPGVASSSGGGAEAGLAVIDGQTVDLVSVTPAATDNTVTASGSHSGAVTFGDGSATASSYVKDAALVSRSEATITGIDLFGGRVTATTVHVGATVRTTATAATAETDGDPVTGLRIDGVEVDPNVGTFAIDGLGTLTVGVADAQRGDTWGSAQAVGLRLHLSAATGGLPAGATVVVGQTSARADLGALEALIGKPTPTPTPSPTKTTPRPTPRPTPTVTHTASATTSGTSGTYYPPTSSGTTTMPPPGAPSAAILARFPGAVFPVVGRYNYSDDFGAYRADIPSHSHEGNDIFAPYGSPIVAVQDGTISDIDSTGTAGNHLHLNNAQGDYFLYCHLSRFVTGLHNGQRVTAGQTIGYVGTTGDAQGTSPHLHFEIHPGGGAAIDPYPYLNAWRASGSEVKSGVDESGNTVTSGFDPSVPSDLRLEKKGSAVDDSLALALDRVTVGLASLDAGLAGHSQRHAPTHGPFEAVLAVANAAGALALKRLKLAAIFL